MDETLADRLREAMKARSMTLRAVGEASGIPYRSLQNYMSGNQSPGAEPLLKLREALHISIDWLLTGEGNMHADTHGTPPRLMGIRDVQELRARFSNFDEIFKMTNPFELLENKDLHPEIELNGWRGILQFFKGHHPDRFGRVIGDARIEDLSCEEAKSAAFRLNRDDS